MPVLLSQRAYAKHRNCSPSYINKLVKRQTIPTHSGKIHVFEADYILDRKTAFTQQNLNDLARLTAAMADYSELRCLELAAKLSKELPPRLAPLFQTISRSDLRESLVRGQIFQFFEEEFTQAK